ncbi:hypothetical protein GJ744_003424 [Endocarpon pusillum]|uniref:Uncharacterized protein n=1 Tax=Endocarpon pusillum TaxID=364733 RepID=A0A8H7AAQ2_9EURO|nr:hypothetical protein GJ744_003424 [Endocarpon pusillum]
MNTWFTEIEDHLDGSLKVMKYHGKRRESRIENVANSDIVLTTYHTLAAERKSKRSPLKAISWFRIVLDEAHTIRRQATTLFAAVWELSSCHRWCLTGTPIQNKLDDLGSLLAFIRAEPFGSVSMFRRYVIAPFSEDLGEATKNLALLLDSICLRRRIERLNLLPPDEHVHQVDLSSKERSHYEETLNTMAYAVSHRSSQQYAKSPFGKFQIQLQLRILYNHGTFQRPFEWGQDDAQTRREEAMNSIGKDGEIRCAQCHERTLILETNCAASRKSRTCTHVFCDECVSQMAEETLAPKQIFSCPYCAAHNDRVLPNDQGRQSALLNRPASLMFDSSGYSAKIEKLMGDVVDRLSSTKSIIFSSWTRSLDLIAWHIKRLHIVFARIDGDTSICQRQAILDNFAADIETRVLLMTTGTGAYGLNLPVANRIFILEPQWNPSIEKQAIARAQRLLQNQSVQVIRYIVRGTVEEDIQ